MRERLVGGHDAFDKRLVSRFPFHLGNVAVSNVPADKLLVRLILAADGDVA